MSEFDEVFAALRTIMLDAAGQQDVARDAPGDLEVRTRTIDPKTKAPGWFGTVTVRKRYVAYHLMPLYTDGALSAAVTPALARRRQGKTCFNFTAIDAALFEELAALTRRANSTT